MEAGDAIFAPSTCLPPAQQHLLEMGLYPGLAPRVLVAGARGTPLHHLGLVACEADSCGSHRTVTTEKKF